MHQPRQSFGLTRAAKACDPPVGRSHYENRVPVISGQANQHDPNLCPDRANRIAKWNGSNWSALGSGMNGSVYALAVSGSDLNVGGDFTTVGGRISAYLARAYLELPTLSILRSGPDVTLSWPTFYETFALQQNPSAANSNTWSNAAYPLTTNGPTKTATVPITPTNHFFRLIGN